MKSELVKYQKGTCKIFWIEWNEQDYQNLWDVAKVAFIMIFIVCTAQNIKPESFLSTS